MWLARRLSLLVKVERWLLAGDVGIETVLVEAE